jgi:eukaryotic-like serine/threonine-protein kinase
MSIGEALAQARRRAGLTVAQISARTRIREAIIRGVEGDDFSGCGGDFYARGHIRAIAKVTGADPVPLIREYDLVHRSGGAVAAVSVEELPAAAAQARRRRRGWAVALGVASGSRRARRAAADTGRQRAAKRLGAEDSRGPQKMTSPGAPQRPRGRLTPAPPDQPRPRRTPVAPDEPVARDAVGSAAWGEPASPARQACPRAEPPWATVLATTVRLWVQRRLRPLAQRAWPARATGRAIALLAAAAAVIVLAAIIAAIGLVPASTPSHHSAAPARPAGPGHPAALRGHGGRLRLPGPATSGLPRPGSPAPGHRRSAVLPAGFSWHHDPTGFSIAVPHHWQISHQGHLIYLQDPGSGRFLIVDQTTHPKPNPLADWRQQEAARISTYPGYHRIRLHAVHYAQAQRAADWEFTYYDNGQLTHVLNRNILASRHHAYALYWSTPASKWHASYHYFQAFAATFRPV